MGYYQHRQYRPDYHPENAILTIEGEALAENNWLGVFYTNDNDELRCGGAIQVIPGQLNTLTAFGDDPVTNEKDGFDFGETYIWKLYDTEAETEYPAFAFYNPEMANKNGVYGIGICEVEKLGSIQTIQVNLAEGWSGFSLPFDPLEQDLSLIFENIEDKLIVLKTMTISIGLDKILIHLLTGQPIMEQK